ncbi:MAG: YihY/virulence factor BrkB family protein [Clostridia bacterium]|nr:YihY/virulence factor BrkB family protein [Clostridia bacterium]
MEKLRGIYRYLREKYNLLSVKKYTTIAGTLVFFLIMSIVPLSFWLTLLIGKLPIQADRVLSLPVFDSVKDILLYVQKEAETATTGASVILIFTTLYSSTNLFYQMRRSGELIYDFHPERQGLKIRLGALVLLVVVMATVVVFLLAFALGSVLFSRILSKAWERIADYALLAAVAFLLVLLLNMYICPYKAKMRSFLPGTIVTVIAWIVAVIGFSVYLKIGNVNRLYGALSTLIVFLLWLYILMIGFIVGVILNSEKFSKKSKKKIKK